MKFELGSVVKDVRRGGPPGLMVRYVLRLRAIWGRNEHTY